jgi:hypothetical protein
MSVTRNDLIALGMAEGPDLAPALAEANRLHLAGAALQTFVRVLIGSDRPEARVVPRDAAKGGA